VRFPREVTVIVCNRFLSGARTFAAILALLLAGASPALPCDLCTQAGLPLSREVHEARIVVFGPIVNAKLNPDGISGTSELRVDAVIKGGNLLAGKKTLTLPHFVPPDPKTRYLIFADVRNGQLDPYRGIPFTSDRIVKYLQEAPAYLDEKAPVEARAARLLYYFKFLGDSDPDIAADAFKEWAIAGNREVGIIADRLPADVLRNWLLDPRTPANRLGLYAFLLGSAGTEQDAELLRRLIIATDDRTAQALDGLLAGYIRLKPQEGWNLTAAVIADPRRPFVQKHAVLRLLRFYYGYLGDQVRPQIIRCAALMLEQPDVQDLMVDQLHAWQIWDLTDKVLALFPKATAPITRRAITRYALLCPMPQAKQFVAALRQADPKLVRDVEESLRLDRN